MKMTSYDRATLKLSNLLGEPAKPSKQQRKKAKKAELAKKAEQAAKAKEAKAKRAAVDDEEFDEILFIKQIEQQFDPV